MEKDDRDEVPDTPGQQASTESSRRISEHAQQRRAEGRRVSPGYGDAQQAQQNNVFLQPNGRYIVRGPRGREHVFDADGTHITSIDRTRQAHQRLIRIGKRAPMTVAQFRQFKELFK